MSAEHTPHRLRDLRDEFAMAALTGAMLKYENIVDMRWAKHHLARFAYEIADAMLAERAK